MSERIQLPPLVIGHVVRTCNTAESQESTALIPGLWARVLADATLLSWSGRAADGLFAVYFDYESDQDGAYSLLVGVGAAGAEHLPAGVACVRVADEAYESFHADGDGPAAVVAAWGRVWSATAEGTLPRAFTTDVEVHAPDGSVDLLIALCR